MRPEEIGEAWKSKVGPGLEEGVWRVCNDYKFEDRYLEIPEDLENPRIKVSQRIKKPGRRLVACGDRWRTTKPLETSGFLVELARIGEDALNPRIGEFDEPIRRFVKKHGLLGLDNGRWQGGPGETVKGYVREILTARDVVLLYKAVRDRDEDLASKLLDGFSCKAIGGRRLDEDGKSFENSYRMPPLEHALVEVLLEVTERVNRHCHVTAIPPQRSYDVHKIRTGWGFNSLIGAAYLQMYWHIAAQGDIRRCKQCGGLFQSASAKREFCPGRDGIENKCKAEWNYHHGGGRSNKAARKQRRDSGTPDAD